METAKFKKAGNLDLVKAFVLHVVCGDYHADGEYSVFVGATLEETKDFAEKHLGIPVSTWRQDGSWRYRTSACVDECKQSRSFKSKGLDVRDAEIYEELLVKQGSKFSKINLFGKREVVPLALD